MKLVSTNLKDLVPSEQFHQKPTGVCDGGLLKLVPFVFVCTITLCETQLSAEDFSLYIRDEIVLD